MADRGPNSSQKCLFSKKAIKKFRQFTFEPRANKYCLKKWSYEHEAHPNLQRRWLPGLSKTYERIGIHFYKGISQLDTRIGQENCWWDRSPNKYHLFMETTMDGGSFMEADKLGAWEASPGIYRWGRTGNFRVYFQKLYHQKNLLILYSNLQS